MLYLSVQMIETFRNKKVLGLFLFFVFFLKKQDKEKIQTFGW